MLRRLVAAVLVAAIAMPLPALAKGGCSMTEPALSAQRCECCESPATAATGRCATATGAVQGGCGCSLRADAGNTTVPPASVAGAAGSAPATAVDMAIIAAALSTPQRARRAIHLTAAPPDSGTVSRPRLCT